MDLFFRILRQYNKTEVVYFDFVHNNSSKQEVSIFLMYPIKYVQIKFINFKRKNILIIHQERKHWSVLLCHLSLILNQCTPI